MYFIVSFIVSLIYCNSAIVAYRVFNIDMKSDIKK